MAEGTGTDPCRFPGNIVHTMTTRKRDLERYPRATKKHISGLAKLSYMGMYIKRTLNDSHCLLRVVAACR